MSVDDLRTVLADRIESIESPPGDLERARLAGRRVRRRRRVATGSAAVAVAVVVGGTAVAISDDEAAVPDHTEYAALGTLDFSNGVRAYADPGRTIHLGGRSFDAEDLEYLDTDAVATPYGVVFFDDGRPMLLDDSGDVAPLVRRPVDDNSDFHPTAKADASTSLVVWATLHDGIATITVRDMGTGEDAGTTELDCGPCADLVIDGIDGGVVFVRDAEGTRTWDSATGDWRDFAGPDTRVADVRNGVVLYDGPAPRSPGEWHTVRGPIDAQLTFDGEYVLYWSSRLESTTPGGPPIELRVGDRPIGDDRLGFYTFDTDGSVLAAVADKHPHFTVYDCSVPSGACTEVGPLEATGGDPMFIGNDM